MNSALRTNFRLNKATWIIFLAVVLCLPKTAVHAAMVVRQATTTDQLNLAQRAYGDGDYFRAARLAFVAADASGPRQAKGYSLSFRSLMRLGYPQAASYFFLRTLQTGDKGEIRKVLPDLKKLYVDTGWELLGSTILKHTNANDYPPEDQTLFRYLSAKQAVLNGDYSRALGFLSQIDSGDHWSAYALHLRGVVKTITGKAAQALPDFYECANRATDLVLANRKSKQKKASAEAYDLRARCIASQGRVQYELEQFEESDQTYGVLPKETFVWADALVEHAWNAFAKQEYNRTLGKLVTYKAPGLNYLYNPEVEVLRAQTYLLLCLYNDANESINEFNRRYTNLGVRLKSMIETYANDQAYFYSLGKEALNQKLHSTKEMNRVLNQFVRSPLFQNYVSAEADVRLERDGLREIASRQGLKRDSGVMGFLNRVLDWRLRSIQRLGGIYVKNNLIDYQKTLISDFDKIAFIKLEMLSRAKDKLLKRPVRGEREWGSVEPKRRDNQYYWTFNGEFWNDEIGDYVFGLQSECGKTAKN